MSKWRLIPLVIFAGLSVFLWRGLSLDPQDLPSVQIGRRLPDFSLPVLGHKGQTLKFSSLNDNLFLLNVWASWCAACMEEQVFLLQLARDGIPIYGLNYKDSPKAALKWLRDWGNPFRQVGIDRKGKAAIDLGVYGAPETFLIDKQGIIRLRHVGILDEKIWKNEFLPYFKHEI